MQSYFALITGVMTNNKEKILVIKLSALGDFVISLGAMESIRKHHKDAHITLLTTQLFRDMAEKSGYFDKVVIDNRPSIFNVLSWFKLFNFFNKSNFSRVYDLQFNSRTQKYFNLFLNKPEWSGVVKNSSLFYPNPDWRNMHAFNRHKEVLKIAGVKINMPNLKWMKSDISHLGVKKPYILFIPGSAPQHSYKRWPAVRYGALALKLKNDGYNVAVIGTKDEKSVVDIIKKACPYVIDLCESTTFYNIYTLAEGASGIVGNDTGPSHLAALADVPCLTLFCTEHSQPEFSAPIGKKTTTVGIEDLKYLTVGDVYSNFEPIAN